jgi:hypothetical protein
MRSTTIRVDEQTHAELLELAAAEGDTLTSTVRAAATALRRQRFAERVVREMSNMQRDPTAWAAYLRDSDSTSVRDGLA